MDKFDWTTVPPMITAVMVFLTAIIAWDGSRRTRDAVAKQAEKIEVVSTNIALLEKNTNSIKDALVQAVGDKEHAAGLALGLSQGDVKLAVMQEKLDTKNSKAVNN